MTTVRFVIDVQGRKGDGNGGWRVRVCCPQNPEAAFPERFLRSVGTGLQCFPQPVEAEAKALEDEGKPLPDLCTKDVSAIALIFVNITARQPKNDDVNQFGTYLFHTLLGTETWKKMRAVAGGKGIELALSWPAEEYFLSRLPWEMMGTEDGPLTGANQGTVAFSRLVTSGVPNCGSTGADGLRTLSIRPRVLFVVGADLEKDADILPGAEFIGLLGRLEAQGLAFEPRVLLRATRERIRDTVERFRPSIVHFICHGWADQDKGGYLQLLADDYSKEAPFYGDALANLLRNANGDLPPVVVLNACYTAITATPKTAQVSAPLAVELVRQGVPLVVAMSGRVADDACRLFTRCFYEGLLRDADVSAATAIGRREGLLQGEPGKRLDWALPVLFLAEDVSSTVQIQGADDVRRRENVARRFLIQTNPRAFCGRLDIIEEAYQEIVYGGSSARRVLALTVTDRDSDENGLRYGKTRLLEELAARAARQGHLPCLLRLEGSPSPPRTPFDLASQVVAAAKEVFRLYGGRKTPTLQTDLLGRNMLSPGNPSPVGSCVEEAITQVRVDALTRDGKNLQPFDLEVVNHPLVATLALRTDLFALAQAFQPPAEPPAIAEPVRVVVLIDNAHRLDAHVVEAMLDTMLDADGLTGMPDAPVPTILAFSSRNNQQEYTTTVAAMNKFLEDGPNFVRRESVGIFATPGEQQMAYRQYLLLYDPPLAVAQDSADPKVIAKMFNKIQEIVGGIPSNLKRPNDFLDATISASHEIFEILRKARDSDVVREIWDTDK